MEIHLQLKYYVQTANAGDGLGLETNAGAVGNMNITHGQLTIEKLG
ncbi:MAG: hypothetical protein PHQ66_00750 [Candidatus Nanoarchaeia archaeon]|nr:hypothetical protein [Candidatus Nanoarchaeia archaeon]MDD5589007.1 hypothetical protein [Candidatus Nanoarchaeia archaeon]